MSPFEISHAGGSVEHNNAEPGALWLQRFMDKWPKAVWLNPSKADRWIYHQSVFLIRELLNDRMYPVNVHGLVTAMQSLTK